jgi:D-alanine-D-alanine ligase
MTLVVACVIDADIIRAVRRFDGSTRRAMYDISVVRALRRMGTHVDLIAAEEAAHKTLDGLMKLRADVVFNLAYSATPAEPAFAGALELLGLPFTGSGAAAIGLANDKVRSRRVLQAAGIPVPRFIVLSPSNRARKFEISVPSIVKPVTLANSDGIHARSVVDSWEKARVQADRIWRRFEVASMCDAFVIGREFQVGLIERRRSFAVTAIAELHFAGAAAGHGFKSEPFYVDGKRRRVFEISQRMARLPLRTVREMALICRRTAELLGLRGYAKIDLRMDVDGRIFVVEANANPGLWPGVAIWRRPDFKTNLKRILAAALSRARE